MMSAAAAESLYLMDLYNNALLPFINGVLQSTHVRQAKMPVMTSGLSNELVATLNSKTFPMINEQNKMTLLGDNASALLMAYKGAMKNSRHSMIHASWLWELIHYRKVLTAEKVHTKQNPADICTKQDGIKDSVFEQHTKVLLGEMSEFDMDYTANSTLAHITNVNNSPMMTSIIKNKVDGRLMIVNYDI
tara:strand:+ start:151 stop:720 length:570 start_codon:yes stop_codon:yes gene_type:complete